MPSHTEAERKKRPVPTVGVGLTQAMKGAIAARQEQLDAGDPPTPKPAAPAKPAPKAEPKSEVTKKPSFFRRAKTLLGMGIDREAIRAAEKRKREKAKASKGVAKS